MLCLGIETSCDDTGVALVRDGRLIASLLASQAKTHAIFGGVVPEIASREHSRLLGPLLDALLHKANLALNALDLIAVTRGPGLLGSLLAGIGFAKGLALALDRSIIGINHLHAHLLAAGLDQELVFPGLGLVISGGHTDLYRMEAPDKFIRLGRALDDAAGEAFDKAGGVIGLAYPAGKEMDKLASTGKPAFKSMTAPYVNNDNLDFSFSGLKTTACNLAVKAGPSVADSIFKADFCASLTKAIAETLTVKVERALEQNADIKAFYLAGGVAANSHIRRRLSVLALKRNCQFIAAPLSLCADNAAMIAYSGYLLHKQGYEHCLDLEAIPRGRQIPEDMIRAPAS